MEILCFLAGAVVLAAGYVLAKWPELKRTKVSAPVQPKPEPELELNDVTSPVQAIAEAFGTDTEQASNFYKYNGRPQPQDK